METIQTPERTATTEIEASPQAVWDVVTDVARTPEWSPVVKRSQWLGMADGPELNARFAGHNRFNGFRWTRECIVTETVPGQVFSFSTLDGKGGEQTRWRYRVEPIGAERARLTLEYEIVTTPAWVRMAQKVPGGAKTSARQARDNLERSVARIKELAEAG